MTHDIINLVFLKFHQIQHRILKTKNQKYRFSVTEYSDCMMPELSRHISPLFFTIWPSGLWSLQQTLFRISVYLKVQNFLFLELPQVYVLNNVSFCLNEEGPYFSIPLPAVVLWFISRQEVVKHSAKPQQFTETVICFFLSFCIQILMRKIP